VRPGRRALDADARSQARDLFGGAAGGNAVVVQTLLAERGLEASVRTVQRAVAEQRRERRAAQVATVRYETAPGAQMQVDFGEKWVTIGGKSARVYLLVAVLSHSRRLFVKALLGQRGDDWREGIGAAFRRFGGTTQTILGDNAKALVVSRDRATGVVTFHPAYLAFCRDWGVTPRACGPYRARTKGKTESAVKYVKYNALAQREFDNFAELEAHLDAWMSVADAREHGTTHEAPIVRFERDERHCLQPLPPRPLVLRHQLLQRRVSNDAFVDVDTVRYSVPYRLVRSQVDVRVGEELVEVFLGSQRVACHRRVVEPHARVVEPSHFDGLWRRPTALPIEPPSARLQELGRSLADYAAAIGGAP
jgi:transposase